MNYVALSFLESMKELRVQSVGESTIYCVVNLQNGKVYVGKTTQDVRERWSNHVARAMAGTATHFYNAIRLYGKQAFELRVLESVPSEFIDASERAWISKLDAHESRGGYNQTWGGEGGGAHFGHQHSEATKKLIAEKLSVKFKGRKPSPQTIAASVAARCGKPMLPHVMQILRKSSKTPEAKRKWKAKMVGRFAGSNNPMFGVRLTGAQNGFYGRHHSDETKAHWSILRRGQRPSPQTLAKRSESMKRVWASRSVAERDKILVGIRQGRPKAAARAIR